MISLLRGTVAAKKKNSITVMTEGGVGYDVAVASAFAFGVKDGQNVTLHTYLKVSDSALELYGFEMIDEREFFTLLMTVSGIGPKTAMNILSLGSIEKIQAAIARGDAVYLTTVSGLGKKTAERLVVELQSKVKSQKSKVGDAESGTLGEAIDGLVALGYSREEAKAAVEGLPEAGTTEELLRQALRRIK